MFYFYRLLGYMKCFVISSYIAKNLEIDSKNMGKITWLNIIN